MIPHAVPPPTIPIPFHKLLKVVAIVDRQDAQTQALIDQIKSEKFCVDVTDSVVRNA